MYLASGDRDTLSVRDSIRSKVWAFTFEVEPGQRNGSTAEVIAKEMSQQLGARSCTVMCVRGSWQLELCFSEQAAMQKAWSQVAEMYAGQAQVELRPGVGPSPIIRYLGPTPYVN